MADFIEKLNIQNAVKSIHIAGNHENIIKMLNMYKSIGKNNSRATRGKYVELRKHLEKNYKYASERYPHIKNSIIKRKSLVTMILYVLLEAEKIYGSLLYSNAVSKPTNPPK